MRILMLSQFYPPVIGGEERHVVSLSRALAARGHEVTVATLPHPDRPAVIDDEGVTVRSIGGLTQRVPAAYSDVERRHTPPFPDPELTWRLAALVREMRPDIVHGHNWMLHSYLPLKRLSGAALIVSLHDYGYVCARKTLMRQEAVCDGPSVTRCLPCASAQYGKFTAAATVYGNMASSWFEGRAVDRFIAVSQAVAEKSGLVGGAVTYDVLPTFILDDVGAKPEAGEQAASLPDEDFMLYVGDLNRRKGVHVLLDAYRRMTAPPPLVMIGRRGPDMPTVLPAGVRVFESWPHHAVMHAWTRCLFGIAPSTWAEPCGTIVMEANAVGKTMVATRIGGLADLVVHDQTGLQVPPGDAGALAGAMSALAGDAALRSRLAQAARLHVERFMAKTIVPKIEAIYREAATRRQPARLARTMAVQ